MNNTKLSAPWMTYVHEIEALFGEDPSINITYDENENNIKLYVLDNIKAEAIQKILPMEKKFGNVVLKITIIPGDVEATPENILKIAFEDNPVMENVISVQGLGSIFTYAVFKKKVVQFFNDQMNDLHGLKSTLYEDIARDVLETDGSVFYSTSNID